MFYHPTLMELQAHAHVLELRESAAVGGTARRLLILIRRDARARRELTASSTSAPVRRIARSDF
jgi:hypothetical protein